MTGPGWLGLKCVKTGSLITVFGNTSKSITVIVKRFVFFCFVLLSLVERYRAQRGISNDEIGEQGLLLSAANHGAPFYKVVTVGDVLLCSVLVSLGWLQLEVLLAVVTERTLVCNMMGNANVVPAVHETN